MPGGPVAVVSGSNVTMPYAMSALGREAMRECFEHRRETIGEMLLYAKRGMSEGYGSPLWAFTNALTEAVAPESFHPKEERREHLQLFNLFGDPTMKLHAPQTVELTISAHAIVGKGIHVVGQSPMNGKAEIELVVRRDRLRKEPPARLLYDASERSRAAFDVTYREANDPRLSNVSRVVSAGQFEVDLPVPADAYGPCHVRVFISGANGYALGASDVVIARN